MTEIVDSNLPSSANFQILKEEFELKNSLFIFLKSKKGSWNKGDSEKLNYYLRDLSYSPYVFNTYSPFSILKPTFEDPNYIHYFKIVHPKRDQYDFSSALKNFNTSPWNDILSNNDGSEFSFEIHLEDASAPKKFGSFSPKGIDNILESIKVELFESYEVFVTGTSIFTYYAFKGVQHNFKLNFVFIFLILIIFRLFFGTFRSGIFLIASLIWVGLLIYGIMGYFQIPIEILSSGLFIMLAVASIEDYFYILHENLKGNSLDKTFSSLIKPSFFTSFTTIVGFGSLYFSGIEVVERFGIMAAVGAFFEWVAVFFILPAFLKVFKINYLVVKEKSFLSSSPFWKSIINGLVPKKYFGYVTFLLYPFSFYILLNLSVSDSPLSLFPDDHIINKDFQRLKKSRGWEGQASLTFPVEIRAKRRKEIINQILKDKNIKTIENYEDVLSYMYKGIPKAHHSAVESDMSGTKLYDRYKSDFLTTRSLVYFIDTSFDTLKRSKNKIEDICKGECKIIGEIISYVEFMDKVPLGFMKSLGFSLGFVSLILLIISLYYKFPNPFPFILSSLWGPSALLILMWLFNIQINFLSCVFISMMVGVTGDNAIQFLFAHGNDSPVDGISYHESCAFQMGILLFIFCFMFSLSYFAPPREFGPIMAIGFIASLYGDICLAKSFIKKSS